MRHGIMRAAASAALPLVLVVSGAGSRSMEAALAQAPRLPDTFRFAIGGTDAIDHFGGIRAVAGSYVDTHVYAVDAGNHRLLRYSLDGQTRWWRGGYGSAEGQLAEPVALAVDGEERVYVYERGNDRLQVFDGKSGASLAIVESPPGEMAWRAIVDVAVSEGGALYLLDAGASRVLRYSAAGELLGSFGALGSGQGQLDRPVGISVAADKAVWVADAGNARLVRFSARGQHLATHGASGRAVGQFDGLADVAAAPNGDIFTVESLPAEPWTRVQRFDAAMAPITQWGDREFVDIASIGINAGSGLYVADEGSNTLQRFSFTGEFDDRWGGDHETPGELGGVGGIDLTPDGKLLLATDPGYHRVRRFDPSGILKDSFGQGGTKDAGHLNRPLDVAAAPDGTLYVADTDNRRVQRFGATGSSPTVITAAGSPEPLGRVTGLALGALPAGGDVRLFVADAEHGRVLRLGRAGEFQAAWGGGFGGLFGLAYGGGLVQAGDEARSQVDAFDPDGARAATWGGPGRGPGKLDGPRHLSVDAADRVWVADARNRRVQAVEPEGRPIHELGAASGARFEPQDVVLGPDARLYVLVQGRRVLVFGRGPSAGWRVEFFAGRDLAGGLLNVAQTDGLDYSWATGRPAPGVPEDDFSVRAIGFTALSASGSQARVRAQGGARLWVGADLLLDHWEEDQVDETIAVPAGAGTARVVLEYRDAGGPAGLGLSGLPPADALPEPTARPSPTGAPPGPFRLFLPSLSRG